MRAALRLLLALLLLTGAFAAPAAAAGPVTDVSSMVFDVRTSASHTVDWAYASALDRPNCSSWSVGKGRFEARFRATKSERYELVEGRDRDGKLVDTQWRTLKNRTPKVAIDQTGTWKSNNGFKMECTPCGPLSEYGPCKPDPPASPEPPCRNERTASGVVDMTFYRRARDVPKAVDDLGHLRRQGLLMVVETRYSEDAKHASNCHPGAKGPGLPLAQPAAVVVPLGRMLLLDRGQRAEYKGDRPEWVKSDALQDQAECGAIEGVLKMNGCSLTKVKLQVRRVR